MIVQSAGHLQNNSHLSLSSYYTDGIMAFIVTAINVLQEQVSFFDGNFIILAPRNAADFD